MVAPFAAWRGLAAPAETRPDSRPGRGQQRPNGYTVGRGNVTIAAVSSRHEGCTEAPVRETAVRRRRYTVIDRSSERRRRTLDVVSMETPNEAPQGANGAPVISATGSWLGTQAAFDDGRGR